MNVKSLFQLMVEKNASDLFFTTFAPIKIKIEGKIVNVNKTTLTPEMTRDAVFGLMDVDQQKKFAKELEIDFAVSEAGLGRFRINVFHQRGNIAMVVRYITMEMPRLDDFGLPEVLSDLSLLKRGLILMVGAAGNGKSTTLAAMINHRNENTASHILTIEDPIEFLHPNKRSIINQREVGLDTVSYARALKVRCGRRRMSFRSARFAIARRWRRRFRWREPDTLPWLRCIRTIPQRPSIALSICFRKTSTTRSTRSWRSC